MVSDGRDWLERFLAPNVVDALVVLIEKLVAERLDAIDRDARRDWYTLIEAAEREGCSYEAMRMRVERGRYGEPKRVGRTVYVRARSLDER